MPRELEPFKYIINVTCDNTYQFTLQVYNKEEFIKNIVDVFSGIHGMDASRFAREAWEIITSTQETTLCSKDFGVERNHTFHIRKVKNKDDVAIKKRYKIKVNRDYIIEENFLFVTAECKDEAVERVKNYLKYDTDNDLAIRNYRRYCADCADINENSLEVEEYKNQEELNKNVDIKEIYNNYTLVK